MQFIIVFDGPVTEAVFGMFDLTPNVQLAEVQFQTVEEDCLGMLKMVPGYRDIVSAPTSKKRPRAVSRPNQLTEMYSKVNHSYSAIGDITGQHIFLPDIPNS
ncbi:hypothetical protein DPMN_141287 [Dreissena polymorpha]|uniref:Uncharacterized protein n=1 Tax=Dreissena polymorpha TaxID=45954 RepID=A0A9D4GCD7_DREPO|nr:hypothetical protein DPMN_141287 [Dreissena polymorpha]